MYDLGRAPRVRAGPGKRSVAGGVFLSWDLLALKKRPNLRFNVIFSSSLSRLMSFIVIILGCLCSDSRLCWLGWVGAAWLVWRLFWLSGIEAISSLKIPLTIAEKIDFAMHTLTIKLRLDSIVVKLAYHFVCSVAKMTKGAAATALIKADRANSFTSEWV